MNLNEDDWEIVALVNRELVHYISLLEDAREREAITSVFNISRLGNQLMQHNTPWKLVKGSAEDKSRAGTVVGVSINLSCLLSVLVQPYLPNLSSSLQEQLKVTSLDIVNAIPEHFFMMLTAGHLIGEPSPLVVEIKPETIANLKVRYAGKQADRPGKETGGPDKELASKLEKLVLDQGEKVRQAKTNKEEKAVIDIEV